MSYHNIVDGYGQKIMAPSLAWISSREQGHATRAACQFFELAHHYFG